MRKLSDRQKAEIIKNYVELVVDNMDTKTLEQFASDELTDYYDNCSEAELKEFVDNYDDELYDQLLNGTIHTEED